MLKIAQTMCIWSMVIVAVERFMLVRYPVRGVKLCTLRTKWCWICLMLICSLIYNIPRFFDSCVMTFVDACTLEVLTSRRVYAPKFNNTLYYDIYMYICYVCLLYIGPLVIVSVINVFLIRAVKQSRAGSQVTSSDTRRSKASHLRSVDNNAIRILVFVVLLFVLCETPELVIKIFTFIDRHSDSVNISRQVLRDAVVVNELLMVVNSSVNFIIYFTFGKKFRSTVKNAFQFTKIKFNIPRKQPETMPLTIS